MKTLNFFVILSIFVTFLINACNASSEDFYTIYVKHPFEVTDDKDPKYLELIDSIIEQIHDIIINNKDLYEDPSKLDEFQSEYEKKNAAGVYKMDYGKYGGIIYRIFNYDDTTAIKAFIPVELKDQIKAIPHVSSVSISIKYDPAENDAETDKEAKVNANNNIVKEGEDDFYMISVISPFDSNVSEKDPDYKSYVSAICDEIHDIIMNNKSTYKDPAKLDQIQEDYEKDVASGKYLLDYGKYGTVYAAYSLYGTITFNAYINPSLVEKIEAIENVKSVSIPHSYEPADEIASNISTNTVDCKAKSLGYECCAADNTTVYYQDENGDWGYDYVKGDWCGITPVEVETESCFSEKLGYPCCNTCDIILTDSDGSWAVENNEWCGIRNSCKF